MEGRTASLPRVTVCTVSHQRHHCTPQGGCTAGLVSAVGYRMGFMCRHTHTHTHAHAHTHTHTHTHTHARQSHSLFTHRPHSHAHKDTTPTHSNAHTITVHLPSHLSNCGMLVRKPRIAFLIMVFLPIRITPLPRMALRMCCI